MGIEKFFSTVNRTFDIISSINLDNSNETVSNSLLNNSKYLLLDFNSIIHHTSSKLIEELNQTRSKNPDYKSLSVDDIEWMIIREVNNFIISILEQINLENLNSVYVALDGVPTFSKILEQKKRRFMGDFIEKLLENYSLPFTWSKNNISPGTVFMDKIHQYLSNIKSITKNKLIKKEDMILKSKDYEFYVKIKHFEYSDTNIDGEGEMKIYDLISTLPKNENILFYSPDADVILLSMISKNSNNIIVLRYEQNTNQLNLIDIKLLKETIYNYCLDRISGSVLNSIQLNKLISDLVFVFTIFGNDFLPRCEAIQTNQDFLFLIDMYLINLINYGHIIMENEIVNISFYNYLVLVGIHESRLLFRNAYQSINQNYNYANQKNFYLDLIKFKKMDLEKDKSQLISKKFADPYYNFYNNLIQYIDPFKIKELVEKFKDPKIKNFHGCLEFYLYDRNKVYEIIHNALETSLPINSLFTLDFNYFTSNSNYEKLKSTQFQSQIKKHLMNMREMGPRERELYLINNKLDKYYSLFNPTNEFFQSILSTRKINELYYYQKYFKNEDRKQCVNSYLKGFKWVFQYYFNRVSGMKSQLNIDETWYYQYYKAPLLVSILNYYSPTSIDTNFKPIHLNISPLEQLLYITPVRLTDLSKQDFYKLFVEFKSGKFVDESFVKKIKAFIEKHPHYFYNLDEIYIGIKTGSIKKNIFDCSNSIFISKCHYLILDYVVNINQFASKLREIEDTVPIKKRRSKNFQVF
jgi:5'-3' exonuclease